MNADASGPTGYAEENRTVLGAFENLPLAVHVMREDGRIVAVNTLFQQMFGGTRQRYLGKHMAILNTYSVGANLRLLEQVLAEISASGSWRADIPSQRADGSIFAARALIRPMRLGDRRYLVCFQEELRGAEAAGVRTRIETYAGEHEGPAWRCRGDGRRSRGTFRFPPSKSLEGPRGEIAP